MKILILINDLAGGGAQRVVQTLTADWATRGHQVTVATLEGEKAYELSSEVEHVTLPLARLSWGILKVPMLFAQTVALIRLVNIRRPDVVISFLPRANLINVLSARIGSSRPAVISERTMSVALYADGGWQGSLMLWAIERLYPLADRAICLSDAVSASLIRLGLSERVVDTIYNPQDIARIRRQAQEGISLRPSGRFIASVGRLVEQKDYPTMLRAFERLSGGFEVDLVIIGDGSERSRLQEMAAELGIASRVHFAGWVENPFPTLAEAEVFLLSSAIEGFGNVIVEAMALGLPVVCTDAVGGPSEILEGGEHGFLVPIGDDKALAARVAELLRDDQVKQRYVNRSLERARDFDVEEVSPQFLDAMERAVSDWNDSASQQPRGRGDARS